MLFKAVAVRGPIRSRDVGHSALLHDARLTILGSL
jgi:hypothetical protein